MKISNFYNKHKNSIVVFIGIIAICSVGVCIYKVANNQEIIKIEDNLPNDESHIVAKNIILANVNGEIKLIGVNEEKEIDTLNLKQISDTTFIYSNSKDFKSMYVYDLSQNKFSNITIQDNKLTNKEVVSLKDKDIELSNFKVEGDNIYTLSNDCKTMNKISIKDASIKNIVIKEPIENWVVSGNFIVYSSGTKLYSVNTSDDSINNIDIGDTTTGLFLVDEQVVGFNKFGSGKDTSIMLEITPSDLSIKNMIKFNTPNISGITPDSEDKNIFFGQVINNTENETVQSISNVDLEKFNKVEADITTNKDTLKFTYNQSNTVTAKGYIYSLVDKKIEIIDTINSQTLKALEADTNSFMPVIE